MSYIDPDGLIFDVTKDMHRGVSKIVSRIKRNDNIVMVVSNIALGEILMVYVEKLYSQLRVILKKPEYTDPLYTLIRLKADLKERFKLGYVPDRMFAYDFAELIASVDDRISDNDRYILAYAAADPYATKFYTTDKDIILAARNLEETIKEKRKELNFNQLSLDILSPENY